MFADEGETFESDDIDDECLKTEEFDEKKQELTNKTDAKMRDKTDDYDYKRIKTDVMDMGEKAVDDKKNKADDDDDNDKRNQTDVVDMRDKAVESVD